MSEPLLTRRAALYAGLAAVLYPQAAALRAADAPISNPLASFKLSWADALPWATVIDVTRVPGKTLEDRLAAAQAAVVARGGGVVYFPPGTYRFQDSIRLLDGVILRGADPGPVRSAQHEKFAPPTRFEFPRYVPLLEGDGTPIASAFKGIYLAQPATASHVGLIHLSIDHGHVHFADDGSDQHRAGSRRFVVGCLLRNAAVADPAIPNLTIGQLPWQRFTARHHAAINVKAASHLLLANNRLPRSGDDNFTMSGYVLLGPRKMKTTVDGVVFDFDNRPGLYANHYSVGGPGGNGPDGTPDSHPHAFRPGIIIRDNFIYNSGRTAIGFAGDGVICSGNVIRFPPDVWRPTATGQALTAGSSTNDNRAVEMRGWRWLVEDNDYLVHRNWAFDRKYRINDGEGLMHEDHANSTVRDSILRRNRGNTYLSIYKTAGIDGLLVEANEISLADGRQTIASGSAIYVSADRNKQRFPCRNVRIVGNRLKGGGILLAGDPSEKNLIARNRHLGKESAPLHLAAVAELADNEGFDVRRR
ncbi:MAG: glycosyl hydrolase family 28-related protein [Gemmataceae bacterium]